MVKMIRWGYLQALGLDVMSFRQMGILRIVGWKHRRSILTFRRRNVVGATPDLYLITSELLDGLLLVKTLKSAVVTNKTYHR